MSLTPLLPEVSVDAPPGNYSELKAVRPLIQEAANRIWMNFITSERRTSQKDAEKANQVRRFALSLTLLHF